MPKISNYIRNQKYACFYIFLSILLFLSFSFKLDTKKELAFQFFNQDSVEIAVQEVLGADSSLIRYKSRVKTPVCEGKICYEVELIFYWNLVGDFVNYELIPGKPLTKRKHEPFTAADYQKLTELLADKEPPFLNLKKEELVVKLDAVTGATVASIKGQTIEGAVYSCYTLWQIANGEVIDRIQRHTLQNMDKRIVRNIMAINSSDADYFLLNNFKKADFVNFTSEIQVLIKRSKGYFAKNAIEKMPDELFSNLEIQTFFSEQYPLLTYYAQTALLERLQNRTISNQLSKTLIENLTGDQYQNQLILRLATFNPEKFNDPAIRKLAKKLIINTYDK